MIDLPIFGQYFHFRTPESTRKAKVFQWLLGPILESKGMLTIFSETAEKSKKNVEEQKRAKYLKIWAKIYKIWKYFEKGQGIAGDINC